MSAKKLKELAAEAEALAEATPGRLVESGFDKWSARVRGLSSTLTVDGGSLPVEWLKAELTSQALGDLIGGLRTIWQYAGGAYSASNKGLVANGLQTIGAALRSGAGTSSGGVFLSFSHVDEAVAALLFDALDTAGLAPFKSSDPQKGLPPGEGYFENLLKKLREVDCLVLLATPSSVAEPWPTFEAGALVGRGRPVLSICVGVGIDQLPAPLRPIQAVASADHHKVKHALARLVAREFNELWRGPALEKLEAFLERSSPKVRPPGRTAGRAKTEYDLFAERPDDYDPFAKD